MAARRIRKPNVLLDRVSWLAGVRKPVLETLSEFLAVAVVLQRWFFGAAETPGLPHLYWLPVLLASCQYGLSGGMIAAGRGLCGVLVWSFPAVGRAGFLYLCRDGRHPARRLAGDGARHRRAAQSAHSSIPELADQLAACRRHANDLSNGLERAAAEINALERRIAIDTGTTAALSRSLSLIDMSDRRAAAASYGELFHAGTGAATLDRLSGTAGRLRAGLGGRRRYRPCRRMDEAAASSAIDAMMSGNAVFEVSGDGGETEPAGDRHVVRVPSSEGDSEPLAIFVCYLDRSRDMTRFRRRADELSSALATILRVCPDRPSGARA